MDYSAAISDDPIEPSPWGSSSPRATRTPFAGSAPDSPDAPRPGHSRDESQTSIGEPALSTAEIPNAAIEQHNQIVEGQPQQSEQQAQIQQQLGQPQQGAQQRQNAARYHNARQQRPVPQYKLQAKVTALERTGRKDPVLRFDVYVRIA